MRNFGGRGNEVMDAVNGESFRWNKSSRSVDTRSLRASIIKSIRSFIICISATIWGGTVSVTDGPLVSCRSGLLGALLPFGPSSFLVFLLSVHRHILLAQLFLKVMILLGKVFHCCCEGLDLPLQGSRSQFVALIVSGGWHRAHATFCLGGDNIAYKLLLFPTDGANWWCRKINSKSHSLTCLKQYLHNKKRRPNREHRCGAGQISSEGQVRTSHHFKVPELEWIMRILVNEGIGAFIVVEG